LDENANIKPSDTRLVLNIAIERLGTDERNRTPKYPGGAGHTAHAAALGEGLLDQREEGKRGAAGGHRLGQDVGAIEAKLQ
jgi:hypothetical protein